MNPAVLALLVLGISLVLVVVTLAVLVAVLLRGASGGHVRARGRLRVPGASWQGEIDAGAKK
jgi:hypothetical protein